MELTPIWKEVFSYLYERGVDSICLPRWFKCSWELPQCVAVWLLVGRYRLCPGKGRGRAVGQWGGVKLMSPPGDERCGWRLEKICEAAEPPPPPPSGGPVYVVDLSLWGEHTEGEKHELVEQILATLNTVRSVLWDRNLWVTNAPEEFLQLLQRHARGLRHMMYITRETPRFENPVVLDPEGPCLFTEEVAAAHREFIVGGIVDKERTAKSATARLAEILGVPLRCRIELRGSTVGVPDRINKIVEIVMLTQLGEPLERAILKTQARRDRIYRLMWEIQKRSRRLPDGSLAITRDTLEEANWIGASLDEVEDALRKVKATII